MLRRNCLYWLYCFAAGLFVIVLSVVSPAVAADIYVHATQGSDENNGSVGSPYRSLGKASMVVANGDTVHLAGVFSGGADSSILSISGLANVTIRQWSGQEQCYVRNAVTIPSNAAWIEAGAPRYQTQLPTGLSIQTISVGFGDPLARDEFGRYMIHLQPSLTGSAVSAPDTFHYDVNTGTLSVNIRGESVNPGTFLFPIEYCLASVYTGGNYIIKGENCTNCRVIGIKGRNYILTNEAGYFVLLSGSGNVIEDCEFFNCGWHHAGFVASGPSVANANNVIRRCTFWGGGAGNGFAPGTQTVFYANGSDVVNGLIEDSTYHCYKLLTPSGIEWGNAEMNGSYTHTNGSVFKAALTHRNCDFFVYTSARAGYGSDLRSPDENADAQFNPSNYSLRFDDCAFVARHRPDWLGNRALFMAQAAYVRCYFANMTLKQDRSVGFGNSRAFQPELTASDHLQTLFESCHLVFDLSGGSGPNDVAGIRFLSGTGGRSTICFLNSAVVNNNSTPGIASYLMISNTIAGTGVIRARGTIFCASTSGPGRMFINDGTMPAANLDIRDCWYYGINPSQYTGNPLWNTQAEWLSAIDPVAIAGVNPGYNAGASLLAASAQPPGDAEVLVRVSTAVRRSALGINLAPDHLRYGPWQADPSTVQPTDCDLADFNHSGTVSADDIFAFLDAWFTQTGQCVSGCTADINDQNGVTADDIFAYLDLWFTENGHTCP